MTSPSESSETFDHVMIDIETMSLHPHNAMILSIGLVEFNPCRPSGLILGERKLIRPCLAEQLALGRHVDPKTQKFWMDQKAEAREHWLSPGLRMSLADTLKAVRFFTRNARRIWANGTQFDLSNIVGLAEQMHETEPMWYYRAPRDMRTFCEETAQTRNTGEIGPVLDFLEEYKIIDHEPISDCIKQAYHVWGHWSDERG